MPYYMDRHDLSGVSAADVAAVHLRDLEVQGKYGVQFVNYWFDYELQHAFCLAQAPNEEAVETVHRESHGLLPRHIIRVDETALARFMGGIVEHPPGEPYVATAFRVILFTDLEGSTSLTQQMGVVNAMSVLRRHDGIVRAALARTGGTEVKHTGDGIMASFHTAADALQAAILMQREFSQSEAGGELPVGVRIGIAAGEAVTDRQDLFGTAVQLAARLSSKAAARTILAAGEVRDLAADTKFEFGANRRLRLKGFVDAVKACEVVWRPA
jgi:class 3 adenylate cyclase